MRYHGKAETQLNLYNFYKEALVDEACTGRVPLWVDSQQLYLFLGADPLISSPTVGGGGRG